MTPTEQPLPLSRAERDVLASVLHDLIAAERIHECTSPICGNAATLDDLLLGSTERQHIEEIYLRLIRPEPL